MIQVRKYTQLSLRTKEYLNSLILEEFGHIPIVRKTEWAIPDWTVLYYEGDQVASFYNIVERDIIVDDVLYKTCGINNVITPMQFRGKGYASKALKETQHFIFNNLNCALGVLLCADDLIQFYERLKWNLVECPVYFTQPSGRMLWEANTMILSRNEILTPNKIDLNGLPW